MPLFIVLALNVNHQYFRGVHAILISNDLGEGIKRAIENKIEDFEPNIEVLLVNNDFDANLIMENLEKVAIDHERELAKQAANDRNGFFHIRIDPPKEKVEKPGIMARLSRIFGI